MGLGFRVILQTLGPTVGIICILGFLWLSWGFRIVGNFWDRSRKE